MSMFTHQPGPVGPEPPAPKRAHKYWVISSLVVALTIVYSGGVLFSRWYGTRQAERRIALERATKQHADDESSLEMMGGNQFDIQSFYASPGFIRRGETVQICYGVSNAKSVTLEPQTNEVWPSQSRCVNVSPKKTTMYTLTATDAAGHTKNSTLVVQVR